MFGSEKVKVFFDTNVFLDLYCYTKNDLEKLNELNKFSDLRRFEFIITEQVKNEFYINRSVVLNQTLEKLKVQE